MSGPEESAPGSSARGRLSLRAALVAWASVFGVLAIAVSIALAVTTSWQRESTDTVIRGTSSVALADQIESHLLTHRRLGELLSATSAPEVAAARAREEERIEDLLDEARAHVDTERERRVLAEVEGSVDSVLRERDELGRGAVRTPERERELAEVLDHAHVAIGELRERNEEDVRRAHAFARRVDDVSSVAAIVACATLLLSLAILVLGLYRWVLRPLDRVRGAVRAGRGAWTPASEAGPREIAELAAALNDAAAALAREEQDRLAFLGGVAHDLRGPLGALELAVTSAQRDAPDDRRLAIAKRQIVHLARMVGDLLDLARAEAGQLELQLTPVDLTTIVREAIDVQRPTLTKHSIELVAPAHPVTIRGDALRIEQAVTNLLTNAVKYSPEGGPVTVSVADRGASVELAVADSGTGIPAREIPSLFMPFRRVSATRGLAPGAGLGLAVVKRIVDSHGGRIDVESTPQLGSTFTITLPAEPQRVRREKG